MVPHASYLTCKQTFSFKVNGKGRAVVFKEGQEFWVTNTPSDQNDRQVVNVARRKDKFGYDFTKEQLDTFFSEPR